MVSRNENDNPHSRLCLSYQRVAKGVYLLNVDNNYVGAHLEQTYFEKKTFPNYQPHESRTLIYHTLMGPGIFVQYIYKPHEY